MGEDAAKGDSLCTDGGNVNRCSHRGICTDAPQNTENGNTASPSKSTSGYLSDGNKNVGGIA